MLSIRIFLGCIILMFVDENSDALEPRRNWKRKGRRAPDSLPKWASLMSLYNCHLLEICTKGGPRACGWDEIWSSLAYFKDICAMYQVNCEGKGYVSFVVQNNIVCTVKSSFVGKNEPVPENDLPTVLTTRTRGLRGKNRTKEWWWEGSTTDQYKYLLNMEVPD